MLRLAVRVRRADAEVVLAELLELAPSGVEETALDGDVIEYAVYGAPGELPELPDLEAAAGGAGVIKVTFASGQAKNAVIIGQDAAADIAVIRAFGVSGATPARLATASGLHVRRHRPGHWQPAGAVWDGYLRDRLGAAPQHQRGEPVTAGDR